MGHGELICQNCFVETGIESMTWQSETGDETRREFVCPHCGGDSFAV